MKARLTTNIIGPVDYRVGDVVEGAVAEELVSVGYAVALDEPKPRPAPVKAKVEKKD